MTPNEFAQYLDILKARDVGQAVVKAEGFEFSVVFTPAIEATKSEGPQPGGWKHSPEHLDNPSALRAISDE